MENCHPSVSVSCITFMSGVSKLTLVCISTCLVKGKKRIGGKDMCYEGKNKLNFVCFIMLIHVAMAFFSARSFWARQVYNLILLFFYRLKLYKWLQRIEELKCMCKTDIRIYNGTMLHIIPCESIHLSYHELSSTQFDWPILSIYCTDVTRYFLLDFRVLLYWQPN